MSAGDIFAAILNPSTLETAWEKVRSNGGCAGGDGETIEGFRRGAQRRLRHLSKLLKTGEYRPRDYRILHLTKKHGSPRPLAIPSIEDRIAQTACAAILTPILDPLFDQPGSHPARSVKRALRAAERWRKAGYNHVVEADITRCFERIPHAPLLDLLDNALAAKPGASRVSDLVAHWLDHAGMALETPGFGLPQGSPLSPLLANLYLDGLDEELPGKALRLVRFADDFLLLCKSREDAEMAPDRAAEALETRGLELVGETTRITDFSGGFEFLGHLFARSMVLKQAPDPDEDALGLMRAAAGDDEEQEISAKAAAEEEAKGYDRGQRVLHLAEKGRRLTTRNLSFAVEEDGRELLAISHSRVDRVEISPHAGADEGALRLALSSETDIAFLSGHGETLGVLTRPEAARAGLHMAQARACLSPEIAAGIAREIVHSRLHNQRAQLQRLNRQAKDEEAIIASKTLGRIIRKLPQAGDVASLRGHEGAAAAVYWPALGRLAAGAKHPFRRQRPARDGLNAAINYLTALLSRDIRAAILKRGLHPGFGVLHSPADGHEACVWDLMEAFRAPLSEGLAATLFNQGRLRPEMFTRTEGGVKMSRDAVRAVITGYESAASRPILSPHSGRKRTWRVVMEEEAGALAAHCRNPETASFTPYRLDY